MGLGNRDILRGRKRHKQSTVTLVTVDETINHLLEAWHYPVFEQFGSADIADIYAFVILLFVGAMHEKVGVKWHSLQLRR